MNAEGCELQVASVIYVPICIEVFCVQYRHKRCPLLDKHKRSTGGSEQVLAITKYILLRVNTSTSY